MQPSNANLETSPQNNQPTSKAVNNDSNSPAIQKPAVNSVSNKPAAPVQEPVKPKSLAELFADPTDPDSTEINLQDEAPDDPNAPVDSLDGLMKRHKMTPEQVYALRVPMPNGAEALTIGELKDKVGELVGFEQRVTQFDLRRIEQEGQLLRAQQQVQDILSMLPPEAIKPEVLKKLRDRQEGVARRERAATLDAIPDWRDEDRRLQEIEGINEMLSDYGFDESFLPTVVDHRAMKFIRDMFLMRSRIKKSLELVRNGGKPGQRPSGKPNKAAVRPNNNPPSNRKVVPTQDDKLRSWLSSKE